MKSKLLLIFIGIFFLSPCHNLWAYDGEVHSHLSQEATNNSQLDTFLRDQLGITNGMDTELVKGNKTNRIFQWIAYGGEAEDFGWFGKISKLTTRAYNHFHDPLKSWSEAGLDDKVNEIYQLAYKIDPVSPILWGWDPDRQNFPKNSTGDWSWQQAREYYYTYLSGKDFSGNSIASAKVKREAAFADCFRAVGQVMHLLQDMSVPLHTRNDVHILPKFGLGRWTYETYTKKYVDSDKLDYTPDQAGDRPNPELIADPRPDSLYSDLPPVSGLFDRNLYTGQTTPAADAVIGLAEYSNANFLTNDTLWKYPHPAKEETNFDASRWLHPEEVVAEDGQRDGRIYFKKNTGEQIEHLMAAAYWTYTILEEYGEREEIKWSFLVDKTCFADYADKLVPRAVGYSAALLDYFFRGDMDLTVEPGICRISNQSEEFMEGTFELYYDTVADKRKPVTGLEKWPWSQYSPISAGDRSADLDLFAMPDDAKTPGEYMLVFRGGLGAETADAVAAAKVTIPTIEMSLPEEGYYALNGESACRDNPATCGFDKIVFNAENVSPQAIAMNKGLVTLMVKYRQGLADQFVTPPGMNDDQHFSTIFVSLPDYVAIPAGSTTRLEFNLGDQKIPLWATDVHLFLFFTEYLDNDQPGRVCMGYKDISEPTPFDFFNVMDKTCLENKIFEAGSEDAVRIVDKDGDGIADACDVYKHAVTDLSVKFADATNSSYVIPRINPGDYARVFVLIDYDYFVMKLDYYKLPLQDGDPFNHSKNVTDAHPFCGVMNQFVKEASDECPLPACRNRYYYPFDMFRGVSSWARVVIANARYDSKLECDYNQ